MADLLPVRQPLHVNRQVATHGNHRPVRVAIHTTECGDAAGIKELDAVVAFWNRQGRGFGAHLIIDADGNTAKCAPFGKITWAVSGFNTGTLHIELIGFARFLPSIWWLR